MPKELTLKQTVFYEGIGLHSGKPVKMSIAPASSKSGIAFARSDRGGLPYVLATADNVTATTRATTIENASSDVKFFTIEHIMSALSAQGIDNAIVSLDAEEPPVADGSSLKFYELIESAGKAEQALDKDIYEVREAICARSKDGKGFVLALPYDGFRLSFTSVNPHPLIGTSFYDFDMEKGDYLKEIAPARTIAYEKEVEALRNMGLGLGGTLENVIVYNDEGWLNELRFADELVRHKVLDLIGDLYLAGQIKAHIVAVGSGHALNTELAKKIAKARLAKG